MIKKLKIIAAIGVSFLLNGCHINLFEELNCVYPSHFAEQEKVAIAVLDAYLQKGKKERIVFLEVFDKKDYVNNQHVDFYDFLNNHFKADIIDISDAYFLPKEYVREMKDKYYNRVINLSFDELIDLEMPRDKKTLRLGFLIHLNLEIINDNEAIVKYGLILAPLIGHGFTVTVKKEQGCWIVDKKTERDRTIS